MKKVDLVLITPDEFMEFESKVKKNYRKEEDDWLESSSVSLSYYSSNSSEKD
jgi:hypothetical protein